MNTKTALIVGASRTLGLGLAAEYAHRGWGVIGTVRGDRRTGLHDLGILEDHLWWFAARGCSLVARLS
jgi:NAD(P)-dependent dehydrogenase (short-subunit alcohol dehydrogenase family)